MDIFKNGSVWLKADFHLHSKADKEFKYEGEAGNFFRAYIEKLKNDEIGMGTITNHNKFDKDEFKRLKNEAVRNDIGLFPGIELSLKEGIHILIVFDDKWYKGHENNMQNFLDNAFYSISNPDTPPYPNSRFSLKETVEALDQIDYSYFIILAHVDDTNGLFNVLAGRTLEAFIQEDSFSRVLALQKSGNKDNFDKLCSLANRPLACVEGTDNAGEGIDAIGEGRTTYLKIGDFNFEAVKYALIDKDNRLRSKEKPLINNSYIKSILIESADSGQLKNVEINLSPELNNFIGIRGSGKSSIIEILRYTLGISLGSQAIDRNYKNELIEYVLKSGGKVKVTIINKYKKEYRIEKIYGQKEDIFEEDIRKDITIDAIFKRPVYFGQKDLSNKNIDFEAGLVKTLIGNRIDDIKLRINAEISEVEDVIDTLKKLDNLEELKKETIERLKNAEHNLELFKKEGVKEKLRLQSQFDLDIARLEESGKGITAFLNDLEILIESHSAFGEHIDLKSDDNKDIFEEANKILNRLKGEYLKLSEIRDNTTKHSINFENVITKLKEKKEGLKEEFAKIKREINIPNLNPDEFLKLNRQIETSRLKLRAIEKSENKRTEYLTTLNNKISELDNLWHEEFKILEKEVQRINEAENQLSISIEYKGRRDKFLDKTKQVFRGSGITETNYKKIQDEYKDFIQIYRNKEPLKSILNENHLAEYNKRFLENLAELLTYQVENKFTIKYNDKPLKKHSLGQRATALILFLLAQKETDVLIIDQPEDDLDNQTIYEDVIKEIKSLKGNMQFIFATHNANIPVLGDSEKVVACTYAEEQIKVHSGTIDCRETQKRIINIMEGGREAFNKRRNIYGLWRIDK